MFGQKYSDIWYLIFCCLFLAFVKCFCVKLKIFRCLSQIIIKTKNIKILFEGHINQFSEFHCRLEAMQTTVYLSHAFVCPSWTLAIPWEEGAAWDRVALQRPLSVSQSFTCRREKGGGKNASKDVRYPAFSTATIPLVSQNAAKCEAETKAPGCFEKDAQDWSENVDISVW